MEIYRIISKYKGTVYHSIKYFKSKEKAEKASLKYVEARAIAWIERINGRECLIKCFDITK